MIHYAFILAGLAIVAASPREVSHMRRLWGIRHLRYWLAASQYWSWWAHYGRHLGAFPNEADLEYLRAIREGRR